MGDQPRDEANYKRVLERVERSCAYREYCKFDITKRLVRYGFTEEEQQRAIEHLVKDNFIDERRYASAFVRDKSRLNRWGSKKIEWSLRQKRIEEKVIEEALEEIDEEKELELIEKVAITKIASYRGLEQFEVKQKLIAFLLSRGFHYPQLLPVVERLLKERREEKG